MSWISDVKSELKRLKASPRELRKFSYLVGSVLMLFGGAGLFKHWNISVVAAVWIGAAALIAFGLLNPMLLRTVYLFWMAFAFALGWIVSRVILIFLFYLVITPIGMIARLIGKKFIDITFPGETESYWVSKEASKKTNYEKMF
jgi:Saxitoxin biosynthesis operon protein SxtJ